MTRDYVPRFVRGSTLYNVEERAEIPWWVATASASTPVACVYRPSPTFVGGGR